MGTGYAVEVGAKPCPECKAQRDFCDCREQRERPRNVLDAHASHRETLNSFGTAPENWGYFIGYPQTAWLPDGEAMTLMADYQFIDPTTKPWTAPRGARIDGASIPRPFWTLVGSPYRGKYRLASVVHDYYCLSKSEGWHATHFMFYRGMRAAGVDSLHAKAMYYAVYHFGPRWQHSYVRGTFANRERVKPRTDMSPEIVDRVARFVARNDPTLKEIEMFEPRLIMPSQ